MPGTQPVVKECAECQESIDDNWNICFRGRFSFQLQRVLIIFILIQEFGKFAVYERAECRKQQWGRFR